MGEGVNLFSTGSTIRLNVYRASRKQKSERRLSSTDIGLEVIRYLATHKKATADQLVQVTGAHQSTISGWLYRLKDRGMADIVGRVDREMKINRSTKGLRKVNQWGWLL